MHFTVDFSYYSRSSLDSVPFFVSSVFDISLDVHLILHHRLHMSFLAISLSLEPFQCGICRVMKVLHVAIIFWHKGSYLVRQKLLFPTPETIKGMYITSFRHKNFWDCLGEQALLDWLMVAWNTSGQS